MYIYRYRPDVIIEKRNSINKTREVKKNYKVDVIIYQNDDCREFIDKYKSPIILSSILTFQKVIIYNI